MPNTLSPNMSLILPTVGQEPGPNWALDINSSMSLIDQHNHAAGSGVQITPAGLSIDTDLPINSNNLISIRSSKFSPQPAPLALGTDIGCIYVSGADLYYNDTLGNQVRLTIAGAVNGTPGSIGGLVAPATATYVPANQSFVWQSNVNTSASLDCGPVILRNIVAGSNSITLSPPNPLPADYTITLPTTTPVSDRILRMSATGAITNNLDVDGSTLQIAANNIKVANGGITQTQMANNSVGTNQIIDLNVTENKLAADSVTTNKILNGSVTPSKLSGVLTTRDYHAIPNTTLNPLFGSNGGTLYSVSFTTSKANAVVQVCLKPISSAACFGNTYASLASAGYCYLYVNFNSSLIAMTSGIEITTATKTGYTTRAAYQAPIVIGSATIAVAGTYSVDVAGGFSSSQGQHDLVLNGYAIEILELP